MSRSRKNRRTRARKSSAFSKPSASRMRRLRQAIVENHYLVHPRALAAAMVRELERS